VCAWCVLYILTVLYNNIKNIKSREVVDGKSSGQNQGQLKFDELSLSIERFINNRNAILIIAFNEKSLGCRDP